MFFKIGVFFENFAKFTRKHLWQSLFLNKVADLKPATLLKKKLWHRYFPLNFTEFLRRTFFYRAPPVALYKRTSLIQNVATEFDVQSIKTTSIQEEYPANRYYFKNHLKDLAN